MLRHLDLTNVSILPHCLPPPHAGADWWGSNQTTRNAEAQASQRKGSENLASDLHFPENEPGHRAQTQQLMGIQFKINTKSEAQHSTIFSDFHCNPNAI